MKGDIHAEECASPLHETLHCRQKKNFNFHCCDVIPAKHLAVIICYKSARHTGVAPFLPSAD